MSPPLLSANAGCYTSRSSTAGPTSWRPSPTCASGSSCTRATSSTSPTGTGAAAARRNAMGTAAGTPASAGCRRRGPPPDFRARGSGRGGSRRTLPAAHIDGRELGRHGRGLDGVESTIRARVAARVRAQVQSLEELLGRRVLVRRIALERAAHGDHILSGIGPFDALPAGLLPFRFERGDLCGVTCVWGVAAASRRLRGARSGGACCAQRRRGRA